MNNKCGSCGPSGTVGSVVSPIGIACPNAIGHQGMQGEAGHGPEGTLLVYDPLVVAEGPLVLLDKPKEEGWVSVCGSQGPKGVQGTEVEKGTLLIFGKDEK